MSIVVASNQFGQILCGTTPSRVKMVGLLQLDWASSWWFGKVGMIAHQIGSCNVPKRAARQAEVPF